MNNAAKLVADAVRGMAVKPVILGGKIYPVKAPTIHTIARMAGYLSRVDTTRPLTIEEVGEQAVNIVEAILVAHEGNRDMTREESEEIRAQMMQATHQELKEALEVIVPLIIPNDFFVSATLAMEVAKIAARPK